MTALNELTAAESFIRTAYERAQSSPGFLTFQIDTFALKLFLEIEQREEELDHIARFDEIIEKLELVRNMIGDGSRRFHAIQVLGGIEPFMNKRILSLSLQQRTIMVYNLALLVDRLEQLPKDEQAVTDSHRIKESINRAKNKIVMH